MMPRFHSALAPLVTIALAGAVRSPAHVRLAQGGIAPSAPFNHHAARPRPTLLASAVPATEEEGGEEELPVWRLAVRRVGDRETGRDVNRLALEPSSPKYVVRTVEVVVTPSPGLGIELTELAGEGETDSGDERSGSLVVVTRVVEGGAVAEQQVDVRVGDTIVGVCGSVDGAVPDECEAMDYDGVLSALVANSSPGQPMVLVLKRMVRRGRALVTAVGEGGDERTFEAYEGENLRMGLIRQGLAPNDMTANRYDNKPRGSGDCGGNGLCCTCVVSVLQGKEHLSSPRPAEKTLLRRVARWRQSCRARVQVADEEVAELRIALRPRGAPQEPAG